jgi:hypothetical protein
MTIDGDDGRQQMVETVAWGALEEVKVECGPPNELIMKGGM